MPISLGNTNINSLQLGSTSVNKAYLGEELVFGETEALPYFNDTVLYFNVLLDNPIHSSNQVTEVINRSNNQNNLINNTGLGQPSYDDVAKTVNFDSANSEFLNFSNIDVNTGNLTIVGCWNIEVNSGSNSFLHLYKNTADMSTELVFRNTNSFNRMAMLLFANPSTFFTGSANNFSQVNQNMIFTFREDSSVGEAKFEYITPDETRIDTTNYTVSSPIAKVMNQIGASDSTKIWKVRAMAVYNRVLTDTEYQEVMTYFQNEFDVTT